MAAGGCGHPADRHRRRPRRVAALRSGSAGRGPGDSDGVEPDRGILGGDARVDSDRHGRARPGAHPRRGGRAGPAHRAMVPAGAARVPGARRGGTGLRSRGPPHPLCRPRNADGRQPGRGPGASGRPLPERAAREHARRAGSHASRHPGLVHPRLVLKEIPMTTHRTRPSLRRTPYAGAAALLALFVLPLVPGIAEVQAQDRRVEVLRIEGLQRGLQATHALSSGWLGMQINGEPAPAPERWYIARVVPDSPADRAGIEDGDRLLAIDGAPASEEVLETLTTELEPGDEVHVRVERESREIELRVTAEARPTMVVQRPEEGLQVLRMDSVLVRMLTGSDTMVVRELRRAGGLDTMLVREFRMSGGLDTLRFGDMRVRFPGEGDTLRTGGALRFGLSPEWDSLSAPGVVWFGAPAAWDSAGLGGVLRFSGPGDTLSARRWHYALPDGRSLESYFAPPVSVDGPTFYWRGQNVVAGAELTPVNEGLAPYFGTERGLLVVDIVEDSPAARAGLRAGDVLIRIDGREVGTVAEARSALDRAYRTPPVPLEIVRERRSMTLEITR
ncbi:MAG: PDZ domain-containing protein [Gemmatimonadales bacterium]|nr:MAG: PDZ domain-containing protein [Gemmatimonadales bacterium]